MEKTSIPQNDKFLNPSSRFMLTSKIPKICKEWHRAFICYESWIDERNLREWEEKIKMHPQMKGANDVLLCRLRKICICDKCRGGSNCKTQFVQE